MFPLASAGGRPFHADVHGAAGSPAGTVTVYDPGQLPIAITAVRVSVDAGCRVVVGTADADGERILSGWLPAGGAGATWDGLVETRSSGMQGKAIILITDEDTGYDVAIEGYSLTNGLAADLADGTVVPSVQGAGADT